MMTYRIDIWETKTNREGTAYRTWILYENTRVKFPEKKAEKLMDMVANGYREIPKEKLSFTVKELEPWTKEELRKQLLY